MPNHISSIKTSDFGCTELDSHLNQGGHLTCKTQTANHRFFSFRKRRRLWHACKSSRANKCVHRYDLAPPFGLKDVTSLVFLFNSEIVGTHF